MNTTETSSGDLPRSKANVRITLTGAEYATIAAMLISNHTAKALAEGVQKAAERGGPEMAIGFMEAGFSARDKVLSGLKKVKQAVVNDNMLEGTIDV
jgi:hypothetical protein